MAIKLYINEPIGGLTDQSDRIWYGGQNGFTLIKGQRGTASFDFEIAAADSYKPTVGSPIYVHELGSLSPLSDAIVYAGKILTVELGWIGDEGDRYYTLTCVSLESCLDVLRIDPPRAFSGQTAGQIVTALFNSLAGGVPITLGTIDLTVGGVLPMQVYRQSERLSDVFTQLATLAGITVIWGVQMSDQTLYFRVQTTVPAPFTLTAWQYETGKYKQDQTDYRNRQLVQGSFLAWSTSNEMFPGDDVTQSVFLRIPVDRVTSAMLTTSTQATATGIFGTLSPAASARPAVGDTFTITPPHSPPVVEDPYTWVDTLDNTLRNQVLRGADAVGDAQNAIDAINGNPLKAGITFSLPTWENDACNADTLFVGPPVTFVLRVKNPGSGGNGVILTSVHTLSPLTESNFHWEGATLSPLAPAQTTGGSDGNNPALTVSVAGAGQLSSDVIYTPGSNQVTLNAPIPAGTSLSIAYYGLGRDTLAVEDSSAVAARAAIEHGSGRYQQLITDTQNADARAVYVEALQALNNFNVIPNSFQFTIYLALLSPGQLLTIAITSPTGASVILDGTWLVQEIQASIEAGVETLPEPYGHFKYTVTVINVNLIATFVDFWENLAIVTPAGSQTVQNTAIQIATPSLTVPAPTDTTPPTTPTTGTPTGTSAGSQWIQEALGRYAFLKSSDLVVDGAVNTRVSSAFHPFVAGDVGKHVIVIAGTGWTPGDYTITGLTGSSADLTASPAAVSTTGGVWALVDNKVWCTTYNIQPSFTGNAVAIISKNDKALNPFALGSVGPLSPGGGDYALAKGNQVVFAVEPDPAADRLMATYFPAGITPAPVGASSTKIFVQIDVQATDFPQPYTPHIPPGGDRHFFDVTVSPQQIQEVQASIVLVGTADAGIIWSLVGTDVGHTTDSRIGTLTPSPNGPRFRLYTAPAVLPSHLTPPLASDVVVIGVQSHADSTAKAFDTVTLVGSTPPPTGKYAAVAFGPTGNIFENSPDAIAWTGRSSSINSGFGLCMWGISGKIVSLAIDSSFTTDQAMVSTDSGVTWTSHTVPAAISSPYQSLVYGGGLWVGVDQQGQVITSTDAVTWAISATVPPPFNGWIDIAYGAGLYVLVGQSSTLHPTPHPISTSPDAITWTPGTSAPANQFWKAITFGGGQFVVVGGSGGTAVCATSPDGLTWTAQSSLDTTKSWVGVAYGASTYVAVSGAGRISTSPDAVTWTLQPATTGTHGGRVRFLGGQFVMVPGDNAGSGTQIWTSPDGVTWTAQTSAITQYVSDVAFG